MPVKSKDNSSPDPIFRPFSWHHPDVPPSHLRTLSEHTHDIATGIATLLSLIEFHESAALDDAPLLSPVDKGSLLRLAIASNKLLAHFSYGQIARANEAQEEGTLQFFPHTP